MKRPEEIVIRSRAPGRSPQGEGWSPFSLTGQRKRRLTITPGAARARSHSLDPEANIRNADKSDRD